MRLFGAACVLAAAMVGCAGPAATESPRPTAPPDRFAPVVRGTDDLLPPLSAAASALAGGRASHVPAGAAPAIRVDEKARTVRIPARFTGARGAVERLLSAGGRNPATSVLATDCSVRDVAAALQRIGLAAGVRPEEVGEDRVRLPESRLGGGEVLYVWVVVRDAAGKETRRHAHEFLSRRADGLPLAREDGRWVYVGTQVLREGDAEILITELSGSLITTNLRDSSGVIYWSPATSGESAVYTTAYYASGVPTEAGQPCEVEVRVDEICIP